MKRYREIFRLVELNTTFYRYPKYSAVEKWRRESPRDFEFTVKANQEISHTCRLNYGLAAQAVDKMKGICRILQARILLIQTPGSFAPEGLRDAQEFFRKVEREGLTIVWETRGPRWEETGVRNELRGIMEDVGISHVTDPFRVMPAYTGTVAYFRLHGLGKRMYYYQYTDIELEELYSKIRSFDSFHREVYVLFNNLSMFQDARRFSHFLERGEFPNLTGYTGLDSVKVVIENAGYPITKSTLLKKLGWRVVDIENGKQVRLEELLSGLPTRKYEDAEDVVKEIRAV